MKKKMPLLGNTNLTRSNNCPIKRNIQEQLSRSLILFQLYLPDENINQHIKASINLTTKV